MTRFVLVTEAIVLAVLMVVVADVYAHKRVERAGGVNVWGYRGPVVRERTPGDVRLLFVGGVRAYGYGAAADGTIGQRLEWEVNVRLDRPATVINAARMGAIAVDYAEIIARHRRLQSDYVVIHDDLGRAVTRPRRSRIAALTGYTPILPLVMEEKGMRLGRVLRDLESPVAPAPATDYITAMLAAVDTALAHALGVLIVIDPATDEPSKVRRQQLIAALDRRTDRSRIRVLDLASVSGIDAADATLDGYSYSTVGRQRVAMGMLPAVLDMLRR